MRVEIWSDIACPWCYIGKRRFEVALDRFDHRDHVEVIWRSFELDPNAPAVREEAYVDRLATKYRVSVDEAETMIDGMIEAGAHCGIVMRFDKARPANTFDAHRLLHLAGRQGVQNACTERLLHATFTRGASTSDHDGLVALAEACGIDSDQARAVLDSDEFSAEVRADEHRAAELGISSVPYFVIDDTFGVAGAQPPELLLEVLAEAWTALDAAQASSS